MSYPVPANRHLLPVVALGLLVGLELMLGATGAWVNPWLNYDRAAIAQGQWWRFITGHLVHLGMVHTLMNMSGLVLILYLFGALLRPWQWLLIGLLTALGISAGFAWLNPELAYYAGMSGVLHGLLMVGLLLAAIHRFGYPRWLLLLITVFVLAKLVSEQLPGYDIDYLQAYMHAAVIVDAHLYGAVMGVLLLPLCLFLSPPQPGD